MAFIELEYINGLISQLLLSDDHRGSEDVLSIQKVH